MRVPLRGLRRVIAVGALALSVAIAIAANASAANTVNVPGTASFWANSGNGGTPSIPAGISVAGATTVNISVDGGYESPFPGSRNFPDSAVFLGRWFTAAHTPIALPANYPFRLNGGPLGDPIGDNSIFNPIGNTLAGNAFGGFGTPGPYSAVLQVPAGAATLEFAWYDGGYADNSGSLAVTVDPAVAGPINTTLNVPAQGTGGHDYTDTGVTLTAGQTVTITASGVWDTCGGGCTYGPDGFAFFDSTLRSGTSAAGSLIGSLDGGASWFTIGSGPTAVTGPGTLWLADNDYLWGYYDESGSLTVTVVEGVVTPPDTTPPIVTSVSNIPQVEATSPAGAVVTYVAPTATDDVDGSVPVTCVLPSGSTFAIGLSTVVCTATDAHGNSASTSFTVSVVDDVPPLVTVPAAITREATGPAGATASFSGVSASDAVDGALTPTCTQASGSVFPIGITTVTCSATDAHGNTGSNSFTVTVLDTTGPAVTVALVNTKKGGDDDSEQTFRVVISATDAVGVTSLTATLNGVTVTNGQIVKLKKTKKGAQKVKRDDGKLQIEATSFLLSATARDAAGNSTTVTAVPSFNDKGKNDDDDGKKGGKKDD